MKSIRATMKRGGALASFMFLICSVLGSGSALAKAFEVTVDTSSLAGSNGYVDFQLNPADTSAYFVTALVQDWSGSITLLGDPMVEGSVTGALPTTVQFNNTTAFNDYFHSVEFGDAIHFVVAFSDYQPIPSDLGTSFALALYGADAATPLLSDDISGSLVRFDLALGDVSPQAFSTTAQVTAVPLPAAAWLLFSGLTGLIGVVRRRA